MPIKIEDIPKDQALLILGDTLIEESENLIKDLTHRITRLKGIKRELLKVK